MKAKLKFIMDGGEVTRYHTTRTIQDESVGHHSFGVAMYCYLLCRPSANLLIAALVHDLAEHMTGDSPAPAKKELGIGDMVNALEERLLTEVGFNIALTESEKRTLKLADIFQGMAFCVRELQMGNKNMDAIFWRYATYAKERHPYGDELILYNTIMEIYNECK
jgi:5'-deoxynucleotidase YfbR-like HD superfamily hydrolase